MEQANPSVHPQRSERVWEIRDHKEQWRAAVDDTENYCALVAVVS